jgi:hypothetical protein
MKQPLPPYDTGKLEGELLLTVLDAWRIATGDDDMPTYLGTAAFEAESGEEWIVHAFFESGDESRPYPVSAKDYDIHSLYVTDSRMSEIQKEKPHLSDRWGNAIYST